MHLILLRHGESELNVTNRTRRVFCGQFETPLTDFGREQARAAGRELAARNDLRIVRAVSSMLDRSRETLALVLEELPYSVELLPPAVGLNERSLGQFEGLSEDEVFAAHPHYRDHDDYRHFQNHFVQKAADGENLADVTCRAWPVIESLLAEQAGDLLVVSHYNTIRCLVGRALEWPQQAVLDYRVKNAQPVILRRKPERFELVEGSRL
jgi:broad specificity phosphatase PhoE